MQTNVALIWKTQLISYLPTGGTTIFFIHTKNDHFESLSGLNQFKGTNITYFQIIVLCKCFPTTVKPTF